MSLSKQSTSFAAGQSSQDTRLRPSEILEINSDPDRGVSLCIPRVFNNINYRRIKQVFVGLRWGFVERVDVIPCGQFKRAYVHFAPGRWNMRSRQATDALAGMVEYTKIKDDLASAKREKDVRGIGELSKRLNESEVKILYDDPWFWKVGISVAVRPSEAPKPPPRTQVSIGAKLGDHLTESQRKGMSEEGEIDES
jgi:hypothetical protein